MKKLTFWSGAVVFLGLLAGPLAQAQSYYQCKDANGNVRFSDRACKGNVAPKTVESSTGTVTPERKAAADARIQRDSALADQAQAQRRATEQAAASAQSQQVQSAQTISNTLDQERAKKASAATSVIPSGGTIFTPVGQ